MKTFKRCKAIGFFDEDLNLVIHEGKVIDASFVAHASGMQEKKTNNKVKSKVRVRAEHIFGFVENSMIGPFIRNIGLVRVKAVIGLMDLAYNLFRKIQIA